MHHQEFRKPCSMGMTFQIRTGIPQWSFEFWLETSNLRQVRAGQSCSPTFAGCWSLRCLLSHSRILSSVRELWGWWEKLGLGAWMSETKIVTNSAALPPLPPMRDPMPMDNCRLAELYAKRSAEEACAIPHYMAPQRNLRYVVPELLGSVQGNWVFFSQFVISLEWIF